ncbi:MAG: CPBP family intramembrane metalloprotease [Tidjanibacter sp.]|nr:CPBP family intramembrane metalloprotease [Tidjanibacter sp.]
MKRIILPILIATLLWFVMFSPLTAPHLNFWLAMSLSGIVLALISFSLGGGYLKRSLKEDFRLSDIPLGVAIGALLWAIFWVGDKVAVWMFPFAEGQIGTIYAMRDGTSWTLIGLLLFLVVGPAEEIFWRGYVQHSLGEKFSPTIAFLATTAIYTLVHIWSLNFMLLVAAAVAGGLWGLMYRLWPKRLWALVISHAVWDMAVFVLFPI